MTASKKFAIAGGLALLFAIALMTALHQFSFSHFATIATGMSGTYPVMPAMSEMGWAMTLGAVAMALWFGGILSLLVALVRSVAKAKFR